MTNSCRPFLVIDFEATCSNSDFSFEMMEVIEVGATWIGESNEVLEELNCFVKPVLNPVLTPFCKSLTGISQQEVDTAETWQEVVKTVRDFVERHRTINSRWGSWGDYDRKQITQDCLRHAVDNPLESLEHVNLKSRFAKSRKIKQVGMVTALKILGQKHAGTHHRALSDVRNIAKIISLCDIV